MQREERRLTAIMLADLVGYSRLMGEDEAGTLRRLRDARASIIDPAISEYGGRIVKTSGDGLLCEFSSSAAAVSCAVDIQTALAVAARNDGGTKPLEFRIGINLGDVIVEDADIFGDGINVAARLESVAQPGGICLSGVARDTLSGELRAAFEDGGEHHLKNIASPVRVWNWKRPVAPENRDQGGVPRPAAELDQPVVAVIPFANYSSDPELNYLADALAEDIITLIARTPGFLVIGRYSTLTYRAGTTDVQKIGRELGARYVVDGSIRPTGNKIRITVQLIDAESRNQIWSDRFDCQAEEMLAIQDEVSAGIVATLHPELTQAEVELVDRYRPSDLDAWSLYRRAGTALFRQGWNKKGFEEAARLYREALVLEPNFAIAHAALSLTLALGHILGHVETADEAVSEAERALELSNSESEVLGFAGCAISDLGDHDRGIDILERAIELNPSNAQAWTALGTAFLAKGKIDDAVEKLSRGKRISPRDPRLAVWGGMLAQALAAQGRIEEGIEEARAACRYDQRLYNPRLVLADLLLRFGKRDEAILALAEARRIEPEMTQSTVLGLVGRKAGEALREIWDEVPEAPFAG